MTFIKICGITNLDDALAAVDAGADALGFNFYKPSPRYVTPGNRARDNRRTPAVHPDGRRFRQRTVAGIRERFSPRAAVTAIQLHGDESPEYCRQLDGYFVIKALAPAHTSIRNKPAPTTSKQSCSTRKTTRCEAAPAVFSIG